jgi:hypothetical protein
MVMGVFLSSGWGAWSKCQMRRARWRLTDPDWYEHRLIERALDL